MAVPFYMLIRPIVYLLAVICFWQAAKRKADSGWLLAAITGALFVISGALSIYESSQPPDGVISLRGHLVPYQLAKGFLENMGLFAIVASLLMLLRRRLKTAQREVRQLAQIAANSADAIASIDQSGAITSWNLGAKMVFGYSGEEMMGQRIRRLPLEEEWEKFGKSVERCLEEGFLRGLSCRMLAKGRREILVEVTLSAITDDDGRPRGVSLFMRDVTEQREIEAELLHASKMAAVGTLSSGVVGEFANLLTVISGNARLGAATSSRREAREAFAAIEASTVRARSVTNNLLTCAKRQVPNKTSSQVSEAADAAFSLLCEEIENNRIAFERHYQSVPDTAFDREQMTQVFVNLIINAINALRGRKGKIEIFISAMQEYIQISVRDDGPSIPRENLPLLFEPFAEAAGLDPMEANARLSLFVCREIVKYHSGSIAVDSDRTATTVDLYLPITTVVHEAGLEKPLPPLRSDHCRVAVVDSDGMIRDLLAQALEIKGFTVETFPDAAAARAAAMGDNFDLAFIDISVRTRDGQRYLEQLKANNDLSVIAIVGEAMGAEELKRIREGLAGCLRKPFGLDEVNALCELVTGAGRETPAATPRTA